MEPQNRRWSRLAKCAMWIGGWTAFGLLFAGHTCLALAFQGKPLNWKNQFVGWLLYSYIYCALTPIVLRASRRYPLERGMWKRGLPVHIATAIVVALLAAALCGTSGYYLIGDGSRTLEATLLDLFVVAFQYHVLIYCAIVGLDHTVNYYRRYQDREVQAAQLQAQLVQAQLDILKMQLHPHFLFNTLNSISVLMQTDVQAAKYMLVCLSQLLRGALQSSKEHEVALRQEVELLESYVHIEQTRFQDRLTADIRIAPETLDARVPYFLLQPLVENAIRHGGAGHIEVAAERRNGELLITVRDDGPGIRETGATPVGTGIGVANTRARLEKLYGTDCRFELRNSPLGGLTAAVTIPFRVESGSLPDQSESGLWIESAS